MSSLVDIKIVANANFAPVYAELSKLKASMQSLSTLAGPAGMSKSLASGLAATEKQMLRNVAATKAYALETVAISSATDNLTKKLVQGKFHLGEYMRMWGQQKKIIPELQQIAQAQARVAQSLIVPSATRQGMAHVITSLRGMKNASLEASIYQKALNTALSQGATSLINFGKNTQWAGRQLTAGFTMPLMIAGGLISKLFYDVDKNLTRLARVYGTGLAKPTEQAIKNIRDQIMAVSKELSRTLGTSAKEVTDIAAELAAAGLTGKDLISATRQASRIVVLGEADKQEAVKATIALQTAYKLNTQELTDAVNFFNAAQAATSTNMQDLIEAVPRVGPVVKGLGGTYKDMVSLLTAMKEGGVPAGEAANAIKNSLARIINPTEAAQKRLKSFGIDIKSIVAENVGSLTGTITTLQSELDNLTSTQRQQAIAELFGKYQFARMTALMDNFGKVGTQSAKVIEMMGLSSNELGKIADEQTKKIQQSASGKFKIAIESIKTDLIPIGEQFLKVFTFIVEKIEKVVEFFNKLGPLKNIIMAVIGGAAVVGPITMIVGLFANLAGQIFKIINYMRMFRQGFRENMGGGLISGIKGGFQNLSNWFVQIDKAQMASQALAKTTTATVEQEGLAISSLSRIVEMYRMEVERLIATQARLGSTIAPMMMPLTGAISPGSLLGANRQVSSPLVTEISSRTLSRKGFESGGRNVEMLHYSPYMQTALGTDVLGQGGGYQQRNALGTSAIFPAIMTRQGSSIQSLNQWIGEKQQPTLSPRMMNEPNLHAVMQSYGIPINAANIAASRTAFSLPTIAAHETGRLSTLMGMGQLSEGQMSQLKGIASAPGAGTKEIQGYLRSALGPQYQQLQTGVARQVIGLYEVAEREVLAHPKFKTADIATQVTAISARYGELLREQYRSAFDSLNQDLVKAIMVNVDIPLDQAGKTVLEAGRKNNIPRIANMVSSAQESANLIVRAFEEMGAKLSAGATSIAATTSRAMMPMGAGRLGAMQRMGAVSRGPFMFNGGGKVSGPGGPTDDKIPAMLSDGEYVIKASSVNKYGTGFFDSINAQRFANGGPIYASNGMFFARKSVLEVMQERQAREAVMKTMLPQAALVRGSINVDMFKKAWKQVDWNRIKDPEAFIQSKYQEMLIHPKSAARQGFFDPYSPMTPQFAKKIEDMEIERGVQALMDEPMMAAFRAREAQGKEQMDFWISMMGKENYQALSAIEMRNQKDQWQQRWLAQENRRRHASGGIAEFHNGGYFHEHPHTYSKNYYTELDNLIGSGKQERGHHFGVGTARNVSHKSGLTSLVPLETNQLFRHLTAAYEKIDRSGTNANFNNLLKNYPAIENILRSRGQPLSYYEYMMTEPFLKDLSHILKTERIVGLSTQTIEKFIPRTQEFVAKMLDGGIDNFRNRLKYLVQASSDKTNASRIMAKTNKVQFGFNQNNLDKAIAKIGIGTSATEIQSALLGSRTLGTPKGFGSWFPLIRRLGRASGGKIFGEGGPTDDKIPAYLSNGEYVVKADSVNKYGVGFMDALNAGKFAKGGIAGYAEGSPGGVGRGTQLLFNAGALTSSIGPAIKNSFNQLISGINTAFSRRLDPRMTDPTYLKRAQSAGTGYRPERFASDPKNVIPLSAFEKGMVAATVKTQTMARSLLSVINPMERFNRIAQESGRVMNLTGRAARRGNEQMTRFLKESLPAATIPAGNGLRNVSGFLSGVTSGFRYPGFRGLEPQGTRAEVAGYRLGSAPSTILPGLGQYFGGAKSAFLTGMQNPDIAFKNLPGHFNRIEKAATNLGASIRRFPELMTSAANATGRFGKSITGFLSGIASGLKYPGLRGAEPQGTRAQIAGYSMGSAIPAMIGSRADFRSERQRVVSEKQMLREMKAEEARIAREAKKADIIARSGGDSQRMKEILKSERSNTLMGRMGRVVGGVQNLAQVGRGMGASMGYMGVGMAASMGSSFIRGEDPNSKATKNALMTGGMLAGILPMMGLGGPIGIGVAALIASAIYFKTKTSENAKQMKEDLVKTNSAIMASSKMTTKEMSLFSVKLNDFSTGFKLAGKVMNGTIDPSRKFIDQQKELIIQMAQQDKQYEYLIEKISTLVKGKEIEKVGKYTTGFYEKQILSGVDPARARLTTQALYEAGGGKGATPVTVRQTIPQILSNARKELLEASENYRAYDSDKNQKELQARKTKLGGYIGTLMNRPGMTGKQIDQYMLAAGFGASGATGGKIGGSVLGSINMSDKAAGLFKEFNDKFGKMFTGRMKWSKVFQAIKLTEAGIITNQDQMYNYFNNVGGAFTRLNNIFNKRQKKISPILDAIGSSISKLNYEDDTKAKEKTIKSYQEEINSNDKKIKQEEKILQKRQEEYDALSRSIEQRQRLSNLEADVVKAKAGGNLIDIAIAQQAQITGQEQVARENAKEAADKKNRDSIDQLTSANDRLNGKMEALQKAIDNNTEKSNKNSAAIEKLTFFQSLLSTGGVTPEGFQNFLKLPGRQGLKGKSTQEQLSAYLTSRSGLSAKEISPYISGLTDYFTNTGTVTGTGTQDAGDTAKIANKDKRKITKSGSAYKGYTAYFDRKGARWVIYTNENDKAIKGEDWAKYGNFYVLAKDKEALKVHGLPTYGYASGGYISGPGGPTDDKIPAMLSDGEYVVRASSVAKYGSAMLGAINEGRYAMGGMVFAKNGWDGTRYNVPSLSSPSVFGREEFGFNDNSTYHITVNVADSSATGDEIAKAIARELDNRTRRAGGLGTARVVGGR